jgi:hypothetical protein
MQTSNTRNRDVSFTQNGIHSRPQRINISPTIQIDAIVVDRFELVRQDGYIYYVSNWDHFAFRLNGYMFHGNVGNIYDRSSEATRTSDCRYEECKYRPTCAYYHDPAKYEGSTERRNYVNSTLMYTPASSARGKHMHFGSLTNLDADVKSIDVSTANILRDHSVHNLLCAMIAMDRAQKK